VSAAPDIEAVARELVERALAAGARAADAVVGDSDGLSVGVRLGEVEKLRRARERRAGLRVFVGASTAIVSTSDLSPAALGELAENACALARVTAPDAHAGLPDPADLSAAPPDLGLYDPAVERLEPPEAIARARTAEEAARAFAPEITNSEGAEFGGGSGRVAYASSHGFVGSYAGSSFSLSVVPVAARDGTMQRDWWYTAGRHLATLDAPARSRPGSAPSSSRPRRRRACCGISRARSPVRRSTAGRPSSSGASASASRHPPSPWWTTRCSPAASPRAPSTARAWPRGA
jgi:PmbA protein